jgi:hypothetical protein
MAQRSLLLKISSNTNQYVDLKCKKFKNLYITNSDSETITINLVIGKDDNAGETSITNGGYILQGISIPQGVTMNVSGVDFSGLLGSAAVTGGQPAITGALQEDDYTLLIAAGDTNKVFTIFIEY